MGRYVVKLGSNIVAHDDGSLRDDVLEHICAEVAERHEAGDDIVIVTSGAIARGVGVMALERRPATMADLQAASAVGRGERPMSWIPRALEAAGFEAGDDVEIGGVVFELDPG